MDYTPEDLLRWITFNERMAARPGELRYQTDVEVLHRARDLLFVERDRP